MIKKLNDEMVLWRMGDFCADAQQLFGCNIYSIQVIMPVSILTGSKTGKTNACYINVQISFVLP